MENDALITVRIPGDTNVALELLAAAQERSKSFIVRKAIEGHLSKSITVSESNDHQNGKAESS